MTSISYPSPAYNAGSVTDLEFERLTSPQSVDGVLGHPADQPMAYADGTGTRRVMVRANCRALLRGFMYDSGATDLPLTLAANTSGATRIDLIVLRLDRATWMVTEAVVQGTPGAGVPTATRTTGAVGIYEVPIATVSVVNGASTLAAGTVTSVAWYVGDNGHIRCTATTRPPLEAGFTIWETDTGRQMIHDGSAWVRVTPETKTGVESVSFSNMTSYSRSVSFGVTFTAVPSVHTNINTVSGTAAQMGSRASGVTTTGFTLVVFGANITTWSNIPVQWTAILAP